MPEDISRITVYLTVNERAKLEHLAKHEKRTVSNWIAYWAETRYRDVFGDTPAPPLEEPKPGKKRRSQAA